MDKIAALFYFSIFIVVTYAIIRTIDKQGAKIAEQYKGLTDTKRVIFAAIVGFVGIVFVNALAHANLFASNLAGFALPITYFAFFGAIYYNTKYKKLEEIRVNFKIVGNLKYEDGWQLEKALYVRRDAEKINPGSVALTYCKEDPFLPEYATSIEFSSSIRSSNRSRYIKGDDFSLVLGDVVWDTEKKYFMTTPLSLASLQRHIKPLDHYIASYSRKEQRLKTLQEELLNARKSKEDEKVATIEKEIANVASIEIGDVLKAFEFAYKYSTVIENTVLLDTANWAMGALIGQSVPTFELFDVTEEVNRRVDKMFQPILEARMKLKSTQQQLQQFTDENGKSEKMSAITKEEEDEQ